MDRDTEHCVYDPPVKCYRGCCHVRQKKEKPLKHIKGHVVFPPIVGECAFLFNGASNETFRTSEITAILFHGEDVFIETANTKYLVFA